MRIRYGKPIKVRSLVGNQTSFSFLGGTSTIDTTFGNQVYQYNWGLSGSSKFNINIITGHKYLHIIKTKDETTRNASFYYKNTSGSSVQPYSSINSLNSLNIFGGTMTATSDYVCTYFTAQQGSTGGWNHEPDYYFIIDLTEIGLDNLTAQEFYNKYNKSFSRIASGEEVIIDSKSGQIPLSILEGTTNRLAGLNDAFESPYNGANNKYGWGTNTDIYRETGVFQGKQCTKIYMGTPNQDAYPYPKIRNVNPYSTSTNSYCTLSFDYYPTSQGTLIPYSYRDGVSITSRCNGTTLPTATIDNIVVNRWNHIEITYRRTNDNYINDGCGYLRIGATKFKPAEGDYWLFANVQTEYKDHATPYVNGTRPDNYIMSCKIS